MPGVELVLDEVGEQSFLVAVVARQIGFEGTHEIAFGFPGQCHRGRDDVAAEVDAGIDLLQ